MAEHSPKSVVSATSSVDYQIHRSKHFGKNRHKKGITRADYVEPAKDMLANHEEEDISSNTDDSEENEEHDQNVKLANGLTIQLDKKTTLHTDEDSFVTDVSKNKTVNSQYHVYMFDSVTRNITKDMNHDVDHFIETLRNERTTHNSTLVKFEYAPNLSAYCADLRPAINTSCFVYMIGNAVASLYSDRESQNDSNNQCDILRYHILDIDKLSDNRERHAVKESSYHGRLFRPGGPTSSLMNAAKVKSHWLVIKTYDGIVLQATDALLMSEEAYNVMREMFLPLVEDKSWLKEQTISDCVDFTNPRAFMFDNALGKMGFERRKSAAYLFAQQFWATAAIVEHPRKKRRRDVLDAAAVGMAHAHVFLNKNRWEW